jgi:hypothetical protein
MFRPAALNLPQTLRRIGTVALACSALVLSACGGGERAEEYRPSKIVSFGDENSALIPYTSLALDPAGATQKTIMGLTYTINTLGADSGWFCADLSITNAPCLVEDRVTGVADDFVSPGFPNANPWYYFDAVNTGSVSNTVTWAGVGTGTKGGAPITLKLFNNMTYDCGSPTIWVQIVARNFGKGYRLQCNLDIPGAESFAAYEDKVSNVATKIASQLALGSIGSGTLVTVMVGQHDVMELFLQVQAATLSESSALAELHNRARTLAASIRSIIQTQAKVVLALTPDLSESPYGASLSANDKALLKRLVHHFNDRLYITELSGVSGRALVGVNPDNFIDPLRNTAYNYTETACDYTLARKPDGSPVTLTDPQRVMFCTTAALRPGTTTYMWADETHLSTTGHGLIGAAAATRVSEQF